MSGYEPFGFPGTTREGGQAIVICSCGHESRGAYFGHVNSKKRLDAWYQHRLHVERSHPLSSRHGSAPLSKEDVGKFFVHSDGDVWKLISFCAEPTASWERVASVVHEQRGGSIHSPLAREFTRLIPEDSA